MWGTVLYGPGDVRFDEVPEPKIQKPTDAIDPPASVWKELAQ
jgi:Alcohol dehydrogenase GroES-associated